MRDLLVRSLRSAAYEGQERGDLDYNEDQEQQATTEQPAGHEGGRNGQEPAADGAAKEQEGGRAAVAASGNGIGGRGRG